MALFPPEAEALALANLAAIKDHYGLDRAAWEAFSTQLGHPDLRIFAALPAEALVENCMRTRVPPLNDSLSPTQAVQVGLVWRLSKRITWCRSGGSWNDWIDQDPWIPQRPASTTPTATPVPPAKERGIKMSSVIDQGDDSEFVPESLAVADRWVQRYISIMGAPPIEEEDATVEQLSALNKRVSVLDLPPFVDLGVWLPFGRRALRVAKFRAWIPDGAGAYIAKELPGPSNWTQWLAAWRVFQTAAIMLDILPLASLQLYERHIEKLVRLYPSAWHLIVMADEKARGEKWARMRLRITSDIAAGRPAPERWDKDRPWIASLHLLVSDNTFWEEQVRSPANAWIAQGGRGAPKTPAETFTEDGHIDKGSMEPYLDPAALSPKKTNKDRRLAKKRKIQQEREELKQLRAASGANPKGKGDGKHGQKEGMLKSKDQTGAALCFGYDAARGPCADCSPGDPCKAQVKRVHKCSICLSPGHRSQDCPQRA